MLQDQNLTNILILSAGTRVELIQYFKDTFKGKGRIICTDNSPIAPTLYVADAGYVVPKIHDENYFNDILDICKKEKISGIFSLIDPELSLLSAKKDFFEKQGIKVIVSNLEATELSFDKYKTANHLKKLGLPFIPSYTSKNGVLKALKNQELGFPIFKKPNQGSASIGIGKVNSLEEFEQIEEQEGILFQAYMGGAEFGVDVYVDLISGKVVDIFIKQKLLMRAGETDKSKSVKNEQIKNLVLRFVESLEFRGQIDIDVFEKEGIYYISEVNPRFGGGYLHAYACGVNFPAYILKNLNGIENPAFKSLKYKENNYMMKYLSIISKDTIIDATE